MCRICGQINETCHSIFNKNPPNDIEDKIKKCLKLEVRLESEVMSSFLQPQI
jgi:hypothetical protein